VVIVNKFPIEEEDPPSCIAATPIQRRAGVIPQYPLKILASQLSLKLEEWGTSAAIRLDVKVANQNDPMLSAFLLCYHCCLLYCNVLT